jgi:circadian clock protein KaiC
MAVETDSRERRATTGIPGLDDVLGGGLPPNRLYLVQGDPGVGKTTVALQFLLEGARRGEPALYVTLSETKEELLAVAASHGWSLDGITLYELTIAEAAMQGDYTLFHPSEVELNKTTEGMLDVVNRIKPLRIVIDSLSELRLLARDPLRYRRHVLALKQFFVGRNCTVLLLDDRTSAASDLQLESIAHGVIDLQQVAPEYGAERRRLIVKKLRGLRFRGGFHDFTIRSGGIDVFPRLVAAEHRTELIGKSVSSGVPELDALLGGGLDCGTSTLILGPAGSGKTSLAMRYALTAVEKGERAVVFTFEEGLNTLLARTRGFGWDLKPWLDKGLLEIKPIDPAELSPGEFSHRLREQVAKKDLGVIVIDSLNGYLNAMPGERHLSLHLHELLAYLNLCGVVTIVTMTQHGLAGAHMQSPVDISYLADNAVLLRYFESRGAIRETISVIKRRGGAHERTLREFRLGAGGIRVGQPLEEFHGVLTGVPSHQGSQAALMSETDEHARR